MRNHPLFRQDIQQMLEAKILDWDLFLKNYARMGKGATSFLQKNLKGSCPFLRQPLKWEGEEETIRQFGQFQTLLIVGSEEELAGVKVLVEYVQTFLGKNHRSFPVVFFLCHPDTELFWEMMGSCDLHATGIMIIASRANASFTLTVLARAIESWTFANVSCIKKHIFLWAHSEEVPADFKAFIQQFQIPTGPFCPRWGFLCFSSFSLTVAKIIGFQSHLFYQGALLTWDQFSSRKLLIPLEGAALLETIRMQYPFAQNLIWTFKKSFVSIGSWYQSVWKQCLGSKAGFFFPHKTSSSSFVKGGKFFMTTFTEKNRLTDVTSQKFWERYAFLPPVYELSHLSEQILHQTCQKLVKLQNGFRIFHVKSLSEQVLGGLLMNFFLEIILLSLPESSEDGEGEVLRSLFQLR